MLCRILGALILASPLVVFVSGCDNRPNIVLPTRPMPPPPRPSVGGGQPAAPDAEPEKKEPDATKPPAEQPPPEDKK